MDESMDLWTNTQKTVKLEEGKKGVSKQGNKWTKEKRREQEKRNEGIRKEGRVRKTEKKWPRKGEIKEASK